MHLALSGEARLEQPETDAHRLFLADGLLKAGVDPEAILKALDLGASALELLNRYSPDQPRVPAGSGRTSGQWAPSDGSAPTGAESPPGHPHAAHGARPAAHQHRSNTKPAATARHPSVPAVGPTHANAPSRSGAGATAAAAALAIARPAAVGLDLGAMTQRGLSAVATFLAGTTEISGAAAATGAVTFAGVLFVPSTGPTGKWVNVPGPGNVSYFHNPDETGITFRYTTADGVRREWRAGLKEGPNGGGYRGPDGRIIARWVKTGAKIGLVVSTAALLGADSDEGKLCPAPVKDNGGELGSGLRGLRQSAVQPRQSHAVRDGLPVPRS